MNIGTTLIANGETTEAMEPSKGSLHHPTRAPEAFFRFDPPSRDPRKDPPASACSATTNIVIPLVRMKLSRPLPGRAASARDRLDAVQKVLEPLGIVLVRRTEQGRQRKSSRVDHNMVLRARFASVRRIRASFFAPLLAGTLEASSAALCQSMADAALSSSSKTWCNRFHTPASFQSRSRRQQVIPLPHPISRGSISHGIPLRRTKRIPPNAARSKTGGRPPLGLRRRFGSNGAIRPHNLSSTSSLAIPLVYCA